MEPRLDIACRLGTQSSRTVDKLHDIWYHTAETGSPLLNDCAAAFDCRVHAAYDLETGKLIVGEIVASEQIADPYEPLIYHQQDYQGA